MTTTILTIVFGILAAVAAIGGYYVSIRRKIEAAATGAINEAEDLEKIGAEKMAIAVEQVYNLVPAIAKPFITRAMVEDLVQFTFDKMEEYALKQKK